MVSSKKKLFKLIHPFAVKHSGERYVIEEIIGKGGYATIVRGIDRDLKRPVALKVLKKAFNHKEEIVLRFLNEGQIMAHLNCSGVVPIYEIGQLKDNSYYFAMPLIEGQNLRQFLKKFHKNFTISNTVNIFRKITKTIAYAHSQGIIHRDLKPENIMIDELHSVYIVDWGLSKYQKDLNKEKSTTVTNLNFTMDNLTIEGQTNGTPLYMSPEQIIGLNNRTTTQSDIFCLGILLYELLIKQNPFNHHENSLEHIFKKSGNISIPSKSFLGESIPSELRAILAKCLSFLPKERYQDAGELHQDLINYIEKKPVQAYRTGFTENCRKFFKRNIRALFLIFVFVGLVINITLIQYLNRKSYLQSHQNVQHLTRIFDNNIKKIYQGHKKIKSDRVRLHYITEKKPREELIQSILKLKNHNDGLWRGIQQNFEYLYSSNEKQFDDELVNKYIMLWLFELEVLTEQKELKKARVVFKQLKNFISKKKLKTSKDINIRLQFFKKTLNNSLSS